LYFFGLLFDPAVIGMGFAALGHFLVRRKYLKSKDSSISSIVVSPAFIGSVLLFGFGCSFRWSCALYGAIVAVDLAMIDGSDQKPVIINSKSVKVAILWGVISLISILVFIRFSGYGIDKLLHMGAKVKNKVSSEAGSISVMQVIASYQTFFSPGMLILIVTGLVAAFKNKNFRLIILALVGFVLALPFLYSGVPKQFIYSIPLFVFLACNGAMAIWNFNNEGAKSHRFAKVAVLLILILPWVIGLKVNAKTLWGPGFELTRADHKKPAMRLPAMPVIGPGMAFSTQEGARPFYGFGYVLGGGFAHFYKNYNNIDWSPLDSAIQNHIPVFQPDGGDFVTVYLLSKGYKTSDPEKVKGNEYYLRHFVNGKDTIISIVLAHGGLITKNKVFEKIHKEVGVDKVLMITEYTSTMSRMHQNFPQFKVRGYFSIDIGISDMAVPRKWEK
jgi:hypothetical protein